MTVTSSLKPSVAARRIASFEKRFGQDHLFLAYHAALPLVLTSDLLYCLWMNFRQDVRGQALNIPWFAVADLLLSSLCHEVGYELYQMDTTVRNEILNRLRQDERFGHTRIEELSNFLLDHVRQQLYSDDLDVQNVAKVQRWAALAYTRPHQTTYELASVFSKLDFDNSAEILRISSLIEALALPLPEFQSLLTYARGLNALIRKKIEIATKYLKELVGIDNQIRIAGVKLFIPERIQSELNKLSSEKTDYHSVDLQGQSFKGQDLTGRDFSYADIRGTDFTNAILVGAKFTHSTAGLWNSWTIIAGLIFSSMLLSLSSGIGAVIMGYYLQNFLITPNNQETQIIAVSVVPLFALICVVIFRRGVEATLGAITLALTGTLAFLAAITLPANWNWELKIILGIAGIIALVVGGSGARLGVLSFLGKWATRWTITTALLLGCLGYIEVLTVVGNHNPRPWRIPDITNLELKNWIESIFNSSSDVNIESVIFVVLAGAVGLILFEAVGMALAMIVNKTLALIIGISWIPFWFLFLLLSETELSSGGTLLILTIIVGLGVYVGWQGINGNEKYAFIMNAAVATTSYWLKGTSFRGANLTDADFSHAMLNYADFSDANLTRTSWFQSQKLDLACVADSYLKSSQIRQLVTTCLGHNKNFDNQSLCGLNLSGANLADSSFINTDLSQSNLQDADLSRTKLVNTQLDQTNLTGACLTGACIEDWNITPSTQLSGIECDYIYTRLTTADNRNPSRYPEDYQEIFEPGEFVDFVNSRAFVSTE